MISVITLTVIFLVSGKLISLLYCTRYIAISSCDVTIQLQYTSQELRRHTININNWCQEMHLSSARGFYRCWM